jgi:hypothetical protein
MNPLQEFAHCDAAVGGQVLSKRFANTKSRKGYIGTKWRLGQKELKIVNVHLYHDDNNTVSVEKTPSIYAGLFVICLLFLFFVIVIIVFLCNLLFFVCNLCNIVLLFVHVQFFRLFYFSKCLDKRQVAFLDLLEKCDVTDNEPTVISG